MEGLKLKFWDKKLFHTIAYNAHGVMSSFIKR